MRRENRMNPVPATLPAAARPLTASAIELVGLVHADALQAPTAVEFATPVRGGRDAA